MLASLLADILLLTVIVINGNPQQLRLSIPKGLEGEPWLKMLIMHPNP